MKPLSARSSVEPFHAMDVLAEATKRREAGYPVISMAVGQPSHPAPKAALEAARAALVHGRLGYTDALGTSSLRMAIARHYRTRYGVDVDPAAGRRDDGIVGRASIWRFWHCSIPAIASPSRGRAIRPIATSWRRSA